MKGYSLRQLSNINGYRNPNSLAKALHQPYPLGISASDIWPSRYGADGKPNGKRCQKALIPASAKPSRLRLVRNPQDGSAE
ncbi:helix-turn-helix domain-containing protein [Stenotrophomonas sp. 17(2023)]|uniref:helix-turn-helix domain-containing protein n=1 Tax=Stenotrophomonas sp. 17(2023) TaxID=3051123 RepID=UPI001E5DA400|nr:helix-turn-helix domain-containing protein [Stenotrophomonas sp. 17(2023)]MCE4073972.1 helix-turn-helix domain-containing protein [Stenotrophomonas acidaminiphila]